MTKHSFHLALIAVPLLLSACAGNGAPASKQAPASPNEIVIGVAGPMTGDLAAFGEQLRRGAEQAVADVNAEGGVLGKKLRLVIGDDQCDPKRAVQVAQRLIADGAVFVDGHFCSGSSIPASELYAEAGVLQITPSSTNPKLTDSPAAMESKTLFRTCGRDDRQGTFAGAWIAKNYLTKKVAVFDDLSPYGRGVADETERAIQAGGVQPVLREHFTQKQSDFSEIIARLKDAHVEMVYFGGYHDQIAGFVRQAREQGFTGDFAAPDALNTSEFWSIAGSAGDGVRFTDASSQVNFVSAKSVVETFRSGNYEPEGYTLGSYAAVQAWAAAAAIAGSTEASQVGATLHSRTIPTVIGDLSWDHKGDLTHVNYAWFVWHEGQYTEEP